MKYLTNLIIILGAFFLINCLKEENTDVTITINSLDEKKIGRKGTVVINAYSSDFNIIDTSKTISFKSKFTNGGNNYDVDCGFFKAENENLYVFCNVDETIPAGEVSFNLENTGKIIYKTYSITIKQSSFIFFKKYDEDIIDLYSDQQTIIVEAGKNDYYLKFKMVAYNKEHLSLGPFFFLDWYQENNELTCHITKNQLQSILIKNEESFKLGFISDTDCPSYEFPLVPKITFKYYNIKKTDIYIGITKLAESINESGTTIAYETNVTKINNVLTDLESFKLDFFNANGATNACPCSFRKYTDTPLYIVCFMEAIGTGKIQLKEITKEKVYNNLNIRYNFRIQPVKNEEKIQSSKDDGKSIFLYYPSILDFRTQNSYTIDYSMERPSALSGITYNENAEDLSCQNIGSFIKRCTVSRSHFEGKKNGYYFTKHSNHLGGKSTNYEAPPIKVILDDTPWPTDEPTDVSKGNTNSFIIIYYLVLILIML